MRLTAHDDTAPVWRPWGRVHPYFITSDHSRKDIVMSDTAAAAPEYIDEGQTAVKIGSTRAALRQARYRGTGLPYVRIGRRIRYRVADLEAYLAAQTVAAGSSPPQQN